MSSALLTRIVASVPGFLLAIVLHEVAHGYVAYRLGDDTAKRAGRLTLSPLAHLDPIGTIFFLVSSWAGFGFGWARPVPVMVERLRHPRRDDILVSLAGPASNLLQAIAWSIIMRLVVRLEATSLTYALGAICFYGVAINAVLLIFNLLPIPPLDGSHVALRLLGYEDPHLVARLAPLGFIVLFLVVSSPVFDLFYRFLLTPILRLLLPVPL